VKPRKYLHKPYCEKLCSLGYIFVADSIWVALQIFEQFCPKAADANPLVAEPETDFYAKWPFTVIQGSLFRRELPQGGPGCSPAENECGAYKASQNVCG